MGRLGELTVEMNPAGRRGVGITCHVCGDSVVIVGRPSEGWEHAAAEFCRRHDHRADAAR